MLDDGRGFHCAKPWLDLLDNSSEEKVQKQPEGIIYWLYGRLDPGCGLFFFFFYFLFFTRRFGLETKLSLFPAD